MKKLRFILIALFFGLSLSIVNAQQADKIIEDPAGNPKFIKFNLTTKADITDSKDLLLNFLPKESIDNFKLIKTEEDNIGFSHEKFQQYHNGIKVEHGIYTIHKKNGQPSSLNGEYIQVSETKDQATNLSEEEALQKALEYIDADTYMWEDEQNELWAKEVEPNGTFYPQGELVYIKDYFNEDLSLKFQPVLAYKFNIYAQKPLSRDYVYVNAGNGEIVFKDAIIKLYKNSASITKKNYSQGKTYNTKSEGFATTRYSNDQIIKTITSGSVYVLREYTRGDGIETYNMQTGTNYLNAIDFTDDNNQWTSEEHNNSLKDDAALDAHWGTEEVWDYWMIKHGRNSFDGNGATLKSYVHFDTNYDNAFWNGSVMTYGDGTSFDALTALDITAHEIGHAVCTYTAGLIYSYESGAINEGFSDIWAACVENYAAPDKSIWLIGEDIGGPIRSMSNPNAYGLPDTYLGTNWYFGSGDNGGVHTNNGPFCFWFYLLSEGGSGTNDNGDGYSVTGISIEKAERIAYRTEAVYLNATDKYKNLREASILAAEDLYGTESNEVQQVRNAWDAVGVYDWMSNYCASQSSNQMYLIQVDIGDSFSNSSGGSYYTDFTSHTADLTTGEAYNVYLKQGGYWGGTKYGMHWLIWIDLNGDDDFDDAGEEVFYGETDHGIEDILGSFVLPDATASTTRMRVSIGLAEWYGYPIPSSCGNITYGEVEDYTVNISGQSGDVEPPTAPTSLNASNKTQNSVDLTWNASTDNVGVAGYKVYKDGTLAQNVTGTNTTIYGLSKETSYSFYVKAYDGADNLSGQSNTVNITTLGDGDTESPTMPQNFTADEITETSIKFSWDPSTDNVGVAGYKFYDPSDLTWHTTTSTSYLSTNLTPGTSYDFYVYAYDFSGNQSSWNWENATTKSDTDNEPPTTPTNLIASSVGETDVLLTWNASTDNLSVKHYNIYKNGIFEISSTGTGMVLSGLTPGQSYSIYINAEDEAGNISPNSDNIDITTEGEGEDVFLCNDFKLTIYTDSWGYETSWEIMDNTTSTIVESGSGYASNSTIIETFTLTKGVSYTFTIYDSYGDGIWNNPGYKLENGDGLVIFEEDGNDFSTSRSHVFTATCTGGVVSGPTFPSYCSANGNDNSEEWIDYVGLGAINNITGAEPGGYGNYTDLTPMLLSAHSYNLYLSAGFSGTWYNEYWRVWIDFNIDGDFDDANELVAEGAPFAYDGIISAPFVVPVNIESGYTVMRVAMKGDGYPSACETFQYGEVEDYPIELSGSKSTNTGTELSHNNTRDINDPIAAASSILFPNPASEYITITNTNRDNTSYHINIYSITGSLVKTQQISTNNTKIDISDLPNGIYTIVINTERETINSKFVKQ